jgi:hypothetical protein
MRLTGPVIACGCLVTGEHQDPSQPDRAMTDRQRNPKAICTTTETGEAHRVQTHLS